MTFHDKTLEHDCLGYAYSPTLSDAPSPVIMSSPHSGRLYPRGLMETVRVSKDLLRQLDDGPVDRLIDNARLSGADVVSAIYPRAVIDLNRRPDELDPTVMARSNELSLASSVKARVGLGVIPTKVMGHSIYGGPICVNDFNERIRTAYWPYYRFLESLVREKVSRHGQIVLLDCHSMPNSIAFNGQDRVDVALGDRFGTTCNLDVVTMVSDYLQSRGLNVSRNRPFAGGRVVEFFGKPKEGVSALQIEFRRGLFMDEATHGVLSGMRQLSEIVQDLAAVLDRYLRGDSVQDAA